MRLRKASRIMLSDFLGTFILHVNKSQPLAFDDRIMKARWISIIKDGHSFDMPFKIFRYPLLSICKTI